MEIMDDQELLGHMGPKWDSVTGQDGASAAMQTIRVGTNVYNSDCITEVVFPGANATLCGTILIIDAMQRECGQ